MTIIKKRSSRCREDQTEIYFKKCRNNYIRKHCTNNREKTINAKYQYTILEEN